MEGLFDVVSLRDVLFMSAVMGGRICFANLVDGEFILTYTSQ